MQRIYKLGLLSITLVLAATQVASAHFPWLEVKRGSGNEAALHCYFGEGPGDADGELISYVLKAKVWRVPGRGDAAELSLEKGKDSLEAPLEESQVDSIFVLKHDLGVMNRGDADFLLRYYSKTGPSPTSWAWKRAKTEKLQDLNVTPSISDGELEVAVTFNGEPVKDSEVTLYRVSGEDVKLSTNESGIATHKLDSNGINAVRAKHIEKRSGEVDGKKFDDVRHFATVTFPSATYNKLAVTQPFPDIPEEVTSFGAAISGDRLYVYGGHTGSAHEYSHDGQAHTLRSLDLKNNTGWTTHGTGPHLQGLAMVAHDGKLYRIGGFTAKNKEGEDHDLWSQSDVASFDLAEGKWSDLPELPEARSSFDAAVLDGTIYVFGGWKMAGDADSVWHETAWSLDLKKAKPEWTALPKQPFQRRAISVAAFDGKLYVIGGMQESGKPTTRVAIYDPKTSEWSEGPELIGDAMTGFGSSSFAIGDQLYASTFGGTLQRLSQDKKSWEVVGDLENARFFHRMLPLDSQRLVFVGGSNMSVGKFSEVEVFDQTSLKKK